MARQVFLCALLFILLAIGITGILFYQYGVLFQRATFDYLGGGFLLNEENYQNVLRIWEEQEEKFEEAEEKNYSNPFKRESSEED